MIYSLSVKHIGDKHEIENSPSLSLFIFLKAIVLKSLLHDHPKILAECAIAERLRRIPDIVLDPLLYNTPLIYGYSDDKEAMTSIYAEYISTACAANLPLLLTAPTWRLDQQRIAEANAPCTINTDAVQYMLDVRDKYASSSPVLIGALVGPQHDCYRPDLAPNSKHAEQFHAEQIRELAATPIDFVLAQTMCSVEEALGISRALSQSGKQYIISFCVSPDGNILDGTPLPLAFEMIDHDPQVNFPPACYFVNCTHPRFLIEHYKPSDLTRLQGIQANGSSKDVRQLDGSNKTEADPVEAWAESMLTLHHHYQVPVLGGCCGTSTEHMQALTETS